MRDANCLAEAGYDVTVITPSFVERWVKYDQEIIKSVKWKYIYLDFINNPISRIYWNYVKTRHRLSKILASWLLTEQIVANACEYVNRELFMLAAKNEADIYISHQQQSLPAAVWAAQKVKSKFAIDIHDLLSDCSSEPIHLIKNIEERYLKRCAYVSTMSSVAAQRLKEVNKLSKIPIVRHNTPKIQEREGILSPEQRSSSDIISIYWFGQTIGYHSRADQVIRAMPLLCKPVKLVLRGNPNNEFVGSLYALAQKLDVAQYLEIKPISSPNKMVKLAAEHDIALGTQPGKELFHQMAIGNKVFTGMMAGLCLALTDTIAHRQLMREAPGCGFLFPDEDEYILAERLNELLNNYERIQKMKSTSWHLAEERFNSEKEVQILLDTLLYLT
ncbi:hypothetical protein H6G41_23490 [Tolypothrix sp. FACHB-123]|uniref:hypothetical protein n=1 Tax=Tolypothrix sp. FACHB-123 TaxID=2692868 RepID=UPI0016889E6E|nr:hypothetical protein [Tolypothrix sp. FACHB-123]MBD2357540.1 hypothetical protein [Tolypothrix sp. FACHB-123]